VINAAALRDALARHVLEHGDGPVQAFAPAGIAPHGTHDVQSIELEQGDDGYWHLVLKIGGDER
jgi:hypothetical protein